MSAVMAIQELLVAAAPLAGAVPAAKICIGSIPQGVALPAVSIRHIGTVPDGRADAQAAFGLATSRVQVTVEAKEYAAMKRIQTACRHACNLKSGQLGGVQVVCVIRDIDGPDPDPDPGGVFDQSTDFKVTFHEPN